MVFASSNHGSRGFQNNWDKLRTLEEIKITASKFNIIGRQKFDKGCTQRTASVDMGEQIVASMETEI
jgi:hypothetical protein